VAGAWQFLLDNLGWLATAVFTASYFARRPEVLRAVQMVGAALWLAYGVVQKAPPVIVANALVLSVAGFTIVRARRAAQSER
jgi:hypothetical protein